MNYRLTRSRVVRTGIVVSLSIAAALKCAGAWPNETRSKLSDLALQKHCDECHAVNAVRIGPPFIAIAVRHRADGAAAIEPLAQKIIHGGAGNWGDIPMIPNERVSLEEARALVRWILTLAPS